MNDAATSSPVADDHAALWRLAFRPFFLLAALFAVLAILIWIEVFTGQLKPLGYLDPIIWHAHEMIYGYMTAVIAGFVLTAAQNWTGIRGIHGGRLKLLALVWFTGRVLMFASRQPNPFAAVVDLAFYPLLALNLAPYLKDPGLKLERIFFLYFALFVSGNLLVHLESFGVLRGFGQRGVILGANTVVLMVIFMGGRVIPFFTESSIARSQPRTWAPIEVASHLSAGAFLVAFFIQPQSIPTAGIAFLGFAIHLVRLLGWQVRRVRRVPLLWILHAAYFWIVLGFALFGLFGLNLIALGPALHCFAVGGLGGVTYGMMARVSLGHTGRRLHPSAWTVAGFYLLNAAAVARVIPPLLNPGTLLWAVRVSGTFWVAAFALLLCIYLPMLVSPRIDGRPG